jgi:hypothetical protein
LQKLDNIIGFEEKRQFLPKISKACDDNIDPRTSWLVIVVTFLVLSLFSVQEMLQGEFNTISTRFFCLITLN